MKRFILFLTIGLTSLAPVQAQEKMASLLEQLAAKYDAVPSASKSVWPRETDHRYQVQERLAFHRPVNALTEAEQAALLTTLHREMSNTEYHSDRATMYMDTDTVSAMIIFSPLKEREAGRKGRVNFMGANGSADYLIFDMGKAVDVCVLRTVTLDEKPRQVSYASVLPMLTVLTQGAGVKQSDVDYSGVNGSWLIQCGDNGHTIGKHYVIPHVSREKFQEIAMRFAEIARQNVFAVSGFDARDLYVGNSAGNEGIIVLHYGEDGTLHYLRAFSESPSSWGVPMKWWTIRKYSNGQILQQNN
jgi:hypothetical protein